MSEVFKKHQHVLREVKRQFDIDLTSPHGVVIHGRNYPAINKVLDYLHPSAPADFARQFGGNGHSKYTFSFDIPFENGHRLKINGEKQHREIYNRDTRTFNGEEPTTGLTAHLAVPHIRKYSENDIEFDYGTAYSKGEDAWFSLLRRPKHVVDTDTDSFKDHPNAIPAEDLHDLITEYSNHKTKGVVWDGLEIENNSSKTGFRRAREDDLQLHRKNHKDSPFAHPNTIRVYTESEGYGVKYVYNVRDESLKEIENPGQDD